MSIDSSRVRESTFTEVRFKEGYSISCVQGLLNRAADVLAFFEKAAGRGRLPELSDAPATGDDIRAGLDALETVQFQPAYEHGEVQERIVDVADFIDLQFAQVRLAIEEAEAVEQERRVNAALAEKKRREEAEALAAQAAAVAESTEVAGAEEGFLESSSIPSAPSTPSPVESASSPVADFFLADDDDAQVSETGQADGESSLFGEDEVDAAAEEEAVMDHIDFGEGLTSEDGISGDYRVVEGSLGIDFFSEEVSDPEALAMLQEERERQAVLNVIDKLEQLSDESVDEVLQRFAHRLPMVDEFEEEGAADDFFGADSAPSPAEAGTEAVEHESVEAEVREPVDTAADAITLVEFVAAVEYLASHRARDGVFPVVVRVGDDTLGAVRVSTNVDTGQVVVHVSE